MIAQGAQFQAPVDPFAQYGKLQQLQQNQQTNALNQMKMDEYQRGLQEQNALRQLNPNASDYETQLFKVNPTLGIAYRKEAATAAAQQATADEQRVKSAAARQGMLGQAYRDISSRPSDANITAHMEDVLASPLFKAEEKTSVQKLAQTLLAMPLDQRQTYLQMQGAKPSDLKPTTQTVNRAGATDVIQVPAFGGLPTTVGSYADVPLPANVQAQKIQIARESRPPAQPRAEQPLEKVIDPVTGKIVFASREEALKGRMTPASSENKPMTALQQQALKKDFANDTSKVKSAIATADELEKLTDELVGNPDKKIAPHPGLSGITGYSALLPSLPSGEAAKAEQKLETFKGKIKALGRAIASQEGKLGNMAVQEWQMVSDAVQAINPKAGNLDVQMKDVVRQARDLARNMKDKFDLTYEDTTPAAAPGRPAPAANVITNPQYPGFSIGKP